MKFKCILIKSHKSFQYICGRVGGRRFGWVGWPVARRWSWCSADRLQQTTVFFMLWHSCVTTTRWFGWWRLFYSFSSLCRIQHTCSPQTHRSTIFSLVSLLTTNSLYSSTVYILTHNVLPASPGRAQKSKQINNNLRRCSLHDFPISSPFSLTSSELHTHSPNSRNLPSCVANQIPWSIHKPITKDPIASKLNHFLHQSST